MSTPRKYKCPSCGKKTALQIVYGMPDEELWESAQRGEVLIGGCCIVPGQASRECTECGWDNGVPYDPLVVAEL